MPKYWGKQIVPEVGQKQKTEKKKKREQKLVITMASYPLQTAPRAVHAKSPGPKYQVKGLRNKKKCMILCLSQKNR